MKCAADDFTIKSADLCGNVATRIHELPTVNV